MTKNKTLVLIMILFSFSGLIEAQSLLIDISNISTNIISQFKKPINSNLRTIKTLNNDDFQSAKFTSSEDILSDNTFKFDKVSKSYNTAKSVLVIASIFIAGLLVGAWGVFYYTRQKIYSILEEERVYYLDYPPLKSEKSIFHYITLFHVLKRRKDTYKRLNYELRKEMELLEAENSQLKGK